MHSIYRSKIVTKSLLSVSHIVSLYSYQVSSFERGASANAVETLYNVVL